jgi:hypothetical protein
MSDPQTRYRPQVGTHRRYPTSADRPPSYQRDAWINRLLYAGAVIANLVLSALAIQLGTGRIPIPEGWAWAVPILSAAITGALMFLPRAGSETISAQVNSLAEMGIRRRDMLVVPKPTSPVRAPVSEPNPVQADQPDVTGQTGQSPLP